MKSLIVLREFYSPSFPVGGAERQALQLAVELQKIGISVKIATGLWDWGQPRREIIKGISIDRHFTAWGMFGIRGFRKYGYYSYLFSLFFYLLRHRNDYDIIHCHSALIESSIAVLVGQWLNKPSLIRPMASGSFGDFRRLREGTKIWGQNWLLSKLVKANAIVSLNPQITDEMISLGIPKDRIICIPNGVNVDSASSHRTYARHDPMCVAFVGRIHPQKGIDTLLKALAKMKQCNTDLSWKLQLAGTGPSQDEMQSLANEYRINQSVEFLGYLDCVDNLLEHCDIFVLPSLSEGMSNALLEAMARGIPCIATDIPGNNNLIQDKHNGFLVPPNDVESLTEAIAMLAADQRLRQYIGEAAFNTVIDSYSIDRVAKQYANLYTNLLQTRQVDGNN